MTDNNIGKIIKFHYTLLLKNGAVVESTRESDPVQMTLGKSYMLARLEEEIATMKTGDRKSIELSCAEAFGNYHDELVITLPPEQFPDEVEVGKKYVLLLNDKDNLQVAVIDINDDSITVDGNHPLAGKDLIFEIELLEVA